jgi:hypothetical protein
VDAHPAAIAAAIEQAQQRLARQRPVIAASAGKHILIASQRAMGFIEAIPGEYIGPVRHRYCRGQGRVSPLHKLRCSVAEGQLDSGAHHLDTCTFLLDHSSKRWRTQMISSSFQACLSDVY